MPAPNHYPQGATIPFEFDRDGLSIAGWTCTIKVKQFPGEADAISRVITPTSGKWTGFLTEAETAALAVGLHYLVALLENATTAEEEQIVKRFQISRNFA